MKLYGVLNAPGVSNLYHLLPRRTGRKSAMAQQHESLTLPSALPYSHESYATKRSTPHRLRENQGLFGRVELEPKNEAVHWR